MRRIINITDANEIQIEQKLSKNAKVTAWLLAGAIAITGVETGIKTINNYNKEYNTEITNDSIITSNLDNNEIGRSK